MNPEAKTREIHFTKQKRCNVYYFLLGFRRILQEGQLSQKDPAHLQTQMRENNKAPESGDIARLDDLIISRLQRVKYRTLNDQRVKIQ